MYLRLAYVKKDPKRHNIVQCFNDEIVAIDHYHNQHFYTERWELFKISYEESNRDLNQIHMMPISKKKRKSDINKTTKTNALGSILARTPSGKNIKLCQDDKERMVRVGRYISEIDFITAEILVRRQELSK